MSKISKQEQARRIKSNATFKLSVPHSTRLDARSAIAEVAALVGRLREIDADSATDDLRKLLTVGFYEAAV